MMYGTPCVPCLIAFCILNSMSMDVTADVVARLHALPDPNVRILSEYRAEAEAEPVTTVSIQYGDVLALRMTLYNDNEEASVPLVAQLRPHQRPPIIVVEPGGKEHAVDLFSVRRSSPPRERTMDPDEVVMLDIFIYKHRPKDEFGRDRLPDEYVFPKPGTYQLYFKHYPDDAWTRAKKERRGEQLRPPLISNRVTVHVGPPIAGWEELREAGIIHAVGSGDWPQAFESPQRQREIEQLVANADRPWLTRWFEDMKERRRKREEERKQQEQEQR